MARIQIILAFFFSVHIGIDAQQIMTASHTVINIGNATDIDDVRAYATELNKLLDTLDHNQTIIFNGDLITNAAFDPSSFVNLDLLIELLRMPERRILIFLPGDRDWSNSGRDGWENVVAIEQHVAALGYDDVMWPLSSGCPGPMQVRLDETLNLLAINTQWWNHRYNKPEPATATCVYADKESVLEVLKNEIEDADSGNLIIAGHFPIISHGMYGGSFPWHKWLFPIPLVSTSITAYRQNEGTPLEIANRYFDDFREDMKEILVEHHSIFYMSGHELNREVLQYGTNILINSGAPQNGKYVRKVRETIFASAKPGLVLTHFDDSGNAWITSYAYSGDSFEYEQSTRVMQAPCQEPDKGITVNERLVPCLQEEYIRTENVEKYPSEVSVAANATYGHGKLINFFFGTHYRDSWTTPVTVPVLDLDTTKQGLVPFASGGGKHTRRLKFFGEDGHTYVMRSVDKDAAGGLRFELRHTLLSLAVRDQTTTQYPYGAIVATELLDHVDILHPRSKVYLLPRNEKLGPYQIEYGNMLGMLEDFPSEQAVAHHNFAEADVIKGSVGMFRSLYSSKRNSIDAKNYAQARAFDLLIGDWDREEDNWKWAGTIGSEGTTFRPVPNDRDHAFSLWDGVLPWIADREWAKQSGETFDYDVKGMRSLTHRARHLDRFLASELDREDWSAAALEVQKHMTDEVIDDAIAQLPDGTVKEQTDVIAAKLKSRRDKLEDISGRQYDLLAKEVDVVGSIEAEVFEVTRLDDGTVLVEMFAFLNKEKGKKYYSRVFKPEETDEIRVFGLLGDDRFEIDGKVDESILVRIIPGLGSNVVEDRSVVKNGKQLTRVYSNSDKNLIFGGEEMKEMHIPHDEAYQYDRTSFKYNTYTPTGYLYYTSDNGLSFGVGVNFMQQNYDKPDFSSLHEINARVSTLGNTQITYDGTIRHVLGQWDLTLAARGSDAQRFNYFFGLGNETEFNRDSLVNGYYTLKYSNVSGIVGLRRAFWKRSAFDIGFEFSSFGSESGENNILDEDFPDELGGKSLRIARVNWSLDFDLRDRKYLPNSGVRVVAEGFFANRLNQDGAYSMTKGSVEWHGTAKPFTFGLKAGGWYHHRLPPFYDLEYLGHSTTLRGFRRNRFAGDRGGAYFNSDVRIKIIDKRNALVPYKIGIMLFYDVGRVFQSEEDSNVWHSGYGFGVYAVPFKERFVIGLSLGFSVEESAFIQFGFGKLF